MCNREQQFLILRNSIINITCIAFIHVCEPKCLNISDIDKQQIWVPTAVLVAHPASSKSEVKEGTPEQIDMAHSGNLCVSPFRLCRWPLEVCPTVVYVLL